MKKRTAHQIFILLFLAISSVTSTYAIASSVDNNFIFVVALEKDTDELWTPHLYKISPEEGKIVAREKLPEKGAPVFCFSLDSGQIRVILSDGIAASGSSYLGEEVTIDLTIDKNTMRVLRSKKTKGYNDYREYEEVVRADINKSLDMDTSQQRNKYGRDIFLGIPSNRNQIFLLSGFSAAPTSSPSLRIMDLKSFKEIESIPLNIEKQQLGSFFGSSSGNIALLADRHLICLFRGHMRLGYFDPGYVVIIDTESKSVKCVTIGSHPANGIAY